MLCWAFSARSTGATLLSSGSTHSLHSSTHCSERVPHSGFGGPVVDLRSLQLQLRLDWTLFQNNSPRTTSSPSFLNSLPRLSSASSPHSSQIIESRESSCLAVSSLSVCRRLLNDSRCGNASQLSKPPSLVHPPQTRAAGRPRERDLKEHEYSSSLPFPISPQYPPRPSVNSMMR